MNIFKKIKSLYATIKLSKELGKAKPNFPKTPQIPKVETMKITTPKSIEKAMIGSQIYNPKMDIFETQVSKAKIHSLKDLGAFEENNINYVGGMILRDGSLLREELAKKFIELNKEFSNKAMEELLKANKEEQEVLLEFFKEHPIGKVDLFSFANNQQIEGMLRSYGKTINTSLKDQLNYYQNDLISNINKLGGVDEELRKQAIEKIKSMSYKQVREAKLYDKKALYANYEKDNLDGFLEHLMEI